MKFIQASFNVRLVALILVVFAVIYFCKKELFQVLGI